MKFKSILFCAGALAIGFVSCKKDSGSNSNSGSFEGTWTFTGLHSETVATNNISDNQSTEKDVTYSTYDTKDNTGTISFSGGTATGTGVGYRVDTLAYTYEYENEALLDSLSFAFQDTVHPANSVSGYKLVGSDSITFTGSGIVGSSASAATQSGGHYSIADNKMTLTSSVLKDSSFTIDGAIYTVHETADVIIYLRK